MNIDDEPHCSKISNSNKILNVCKHTKLITTTSVISKSQKGLRPQHYHNLKTPKPQTVTSQTGVVNIEVPKVQSTRKELSPEQKNGFKVQHKISRLGIYINNYKM